MNQDMYISTLSERRRQLGMSYATLAKRSGVSMPTVVRVLSGKHRTASFENVVAIASVLGSRLELVATATVRELREQRAREKARRLVSLVQGTSGLEGQALGAAALNELTEETAAALLTKSGKSLWSD